MRKIFLMGLTVLLLAGSLLSLEASGVVDLFPSPWPGTPLAPQGLAPADALPLTDSLSASSCGKCHQKQYQEWQESMHSNSFEDPVHQAFFEEGQDFCSGCHLPMTEQTPVFVHFGEEGPPTVEPNPDFQPNLMSEGVTCAVCHLRNWVRHGPPQTGETEEEVGQIHEVQFSEEYETSEFCANCHQDEWQYIPDVPPFMFIPPGMKISWDNTYGEWQDWQASLSADDLAKGKQCQDCHMPHGTHTWKGGHSPEMLQKAVDVQVVTDQQSYLPGDTVSAQIDLTPRTGHKFPSGGSGGNNRMVILSASVLDSDGNTVDRVEFPPIMRQMQPPPAFFIEVSDDRLLPGETHSFEYSATIPEDLTGPVSLNVQLLYFLMPPPMLGDLAEQFPPTTVFEETLPLITEKDYTNAFSLDLQAGLNMISLPLEPQTAYTARNLAEELGSTIVIALDADRNRFVGFTVSSLGDGFSIEGGRGYIVNVPEAESVTFAGAAWSNRPSVQAAPLLPPSTNWAFVLNGRLEAPAGHSIADGYRVTARNLNTGSVAMAIARRIAGELHFAAVWADLERQSVVHLSDVVEIGVADAAGNPVMEPVRYSISRADLRNAFANVALEIQPVPAQTVLEQNYPNPFNPETWIPYKLAQDTDVLIRIYDPSGALVRKLDLGYQSAGYYLSHSTAAYWDGANEAGERVASGTYFYSMQAGRFSATRRLLIAK